ncbi:hypothetical protein LNK15_04990 [Jeotgalicoccus huakuii]|uniref:DUF6583 family protein n=1 Tax=Jeotgalicoccus marinus TaxID=516700 RepID=UPI00040BB212|nr:DUF6583 family protein [Jeotgalicoccus marinus]MCK1976408.1 hypothetical protein [Jeotgalicoccus huakuii]
MGKKGFTILGVSVGALIVLAIGGYFVYQNVVNTPKNTYLMSELDSTENMTEMFEERFEDELEWYENSMDNPTESSMTLTAETNDPNLEESGISEMINNAEINITGSQDINEELATFGLDANVGAFTIEDVAGYVTGEKMGLTLPFIEDYLVLHEEDTGTFLNQMDPETFPNEENIDFSTFFQTNALTEEEREYFVDEYSSFLQENLPDEAFEEESEEITVGETTVNADKLTMTLSEEEMHTFLRELLTKMSEDERLIELIEAQMTQANMSMPAGEEIETDPSQQLKDAAENVEDIGFPNGMTSVIWTDDEDNIVQRDLDVSVTIDEQTEDIELDSTHEVREDGNLINVSLGTAEDKVNFTFDLNEVDSGYEDVMTLNVEDEDILVLNSTKTEEEDNEIWNLEATVNNFSPDQSTPFNIYMESSTNYGDDQASGDIQLYADDGTNITRDTAVLNIAHESQSVNEVEIPSSENETDIGKMNQEELETYFTEEVEPKLESWLSENFGTGASVQ